MKKLFFILLMAYLLPIAGQGQTVKNFESFVQDGDNTFLVSVVDVTYDDGSFYKSEKHQLFPNKQAVQDYIQARYDEISLAQTEFKNLRRDREKEEDRFEASIEEQRLALEALLQTLDQAKR